MQWYGWVNFNNRRTEGIGIDSMIDNFLTQMRYLQYLHHEAKDICRYAVS